MLLFFIIVLITVAFARKEECDEHSHYHACGTACPVTCENYLDPPEECIFPCVPTCHCDPGFVKAKTGRCVRPENCPRTGDAQEKNCFEPPKKGLCKDSLSRWFFDPNSGQCREFIYGGCEGNGNSYLTFQECMEHCADRSEVDCHARPDPGHCYTNMPRYYYDGQEEACKFFIYGGCGGNSNNFVTIEEFYWTCDEFGYRYTQVEECDENEEFNDCGSTCFPTCFYHYYPPICIRMCIPGCYCKTGFVQTRNGSCIRLGDCPREVVASDSFSDRNCFDEPKEGRCRSDIPMWYYDRELGFCRRFYYGGCDGNGNRYASEEECLQNCRGEFFQKQQCGANSRYNSCFTPCPLTCENYENPPQYCVMMCNQGCQCDEGYVQKEDRSCVLPENCPKKADEKNCIDPPEVGPCRAIVPKWYYNSQTGKCQEFLYGGCEGNGNKYSSEEECLQHCGAAEN